MLPLDYFQKLVKKFGDVQEVYKWLKEPNVHLNYETPHQAIKSGKLRKLMNNIDKGQI